MKILLTGANGFLGGVVVHELGKNHQIITLSRSVGDYKVNLDKVIPNFENSFDLVIHSAGKAHVLPKTFEERQQFYEVNVVGTKNLLKGLEKSNLPKQFVFISSVSVYGQDFGENINEEFSLNAKDPYGLSKIEAEVLILEWCKINNVICTILRLPLLVGENPPGNLGNMVKAISKGYYFNIGGGLAQKSMVLAKDVARLIPNAAPIGGVYNLTDGVNPSFYQLSLAISIHQNKKPPYNLPLFIAKLMGYFGDLLGNKMPLNSLKIKKITLGLTFDDTKAREFLGWKPQGVLEYYEKDVI
ncbi:NAD-dependent epimerase/dehydratase family protein [Flavobacterium eburneipallidum]|uniref:NAD-dependent epimerase/dehydratase family protein n=1 Tax=Flavobacterium eburneipallidum TaxID=3003263 RepID=UPI0022AC8179|nr:NAD-dependent epimerase/dehydratase family protein [Flavobacterium eburneipallidum]